MLGLAAAAGGAEARSPRIYREKVEPHWLEGDKAFWYRVSTGSNRYEFIFVNAETGTRTTAFDHAKLAESLAGAGVAGASAENLPIDALQFADGRLTGFRSRGKQWGVEQSDFSVHAAKEEAPVAGAADERPVALTSTRTGNETSITFVNKTAGEVEIFWVDGEGERRTYGKLKAGDARDQHTFAGHVWLAVDASGKPLGRYEAQEEGTTVEIGQPQFKEPVSRPRRSRRSRNEAESPDGAWRAVAIDHNLSLTNAATGASKNLTFDGVAEDGYSGQVYWSPDSSHLVAIKTRRGADRKIYLVESSPKDQLQPKLHTVDYPKPGDELSIEKPHLFDVTSGKEVTVSDELFPNPWSIDQYRWSPDSSSFSFLYNQRGHQVLRLLRVDAQTGNVQTVIDEHSQTFIDYSGKMFLQWVDAEPRTELVWMSERDGWNHLYLYDIRSGLKNQITRGSWVVRAVDWVDSEKRQVWFRASGMDPRQDPYWIQYCRVNLDGTGLLVLSAGEGTHLVKYSPQRRFLVDTWSRVEQAPVTELRNAADGKLVCALEQADISELVTSKWRAPARFVAKARDGQTDIYGIIHWPSDFDPTRKYPVIESIYAGPQGSFVPKDFHLTYPQQKLADRGFIVLQIDGMGTSNRSKKFHDVCWKNLGDSGFPDRIAWIRAAAAQYPSFDLERIGIYGTSAGGQSALRALLAHGDFYKAAVSDSGCHDNRMDKIWWNEQWMGWPVGPHYEEQSNVTQANKLHGKLLLMVGELDRNVDPSSTLQVVNALIKADKDFELLYVPGAGHGVLGSPYAQRHMLEFFERNLKPGPINR